MLIATPTLINLYCKVTRHHNIAEVLGVVSVVFSFDVAAKPSCMAVAK
jgi:hypothetical protein